VTGVGGGLEQVSKKKKKGEKGVIAMEGAVTFFRGKGFGVICPRMDGTFKEGFNMSRGTRLGWRNTPCIPVWVVAKKAGVGKARIDPGGGLFQETL